jgi:hypothetical protein
MRTVLKLIVALVTLLVGTATLPAMAEDLQPPTLQPAVEYGYALDRHTTPTAFRTGLHNITLGEVVAILGGAALLGTASDMALNGGVFTVLGVVAGAALGSEWYERRIWPF